MKLIYAIVRTDNECEVVNELTKENYYITKIATTGGFLKRGNTTLLIGTEDERVEKCIAIIKDQCGPRQKITVNIPCSTEGMIFPYASVPKQIDVGGATIFVVDINRFEKF